MASSNEYTEDYGRIEPNLTNFINHILFRNDNTDNIHFNFNIRIKEIYSNNRYIIHQFDITDLNTYINRVFIDNYSNYYIIEKGMHIQNDIEKIDNTKYKLSNKIIDNIKKIKYYPTTSYTNCPNPRGDTIYVDMLDIIKNIIVSQSEEIIKKHTFKYKTLKLETSEVYIAGTFNNWEKIKMTNENEIWKYDVELDKGIYEYKFIINNEWKYDENQPIITNNGIINNIVIL